MCTGLDQEQYGGIARRLGFSKRVAGDIRQLRAQIRETAQGLFNWEYHKGSLSELYFLLEPLPVEGALYLMSQESRVGDAYLYKGELPCMVATLGE